MLCVFLGVCCVYAYSMLCSECIVCISLCGVYLGVHCVCSAHLSASSVCVCVRKCTGCGVCLDVCCVPMPFGLGVYSRGRDN